MTGLAVVLIQALFFSISVFISLLFPIGELQIVFINAVVYNNVSKWVGLYFFMPSIACFIYYYSKNYKTVFLNKVLR
jgi:predicted transporter